MLSISLGIEIGSDNLQSISNHSNLNLSARNTATVALII